MTGPERAVAAPGLRIVRRPSPMGGKRPTRADLARFATDNPDALDDVMPPRGTQLRPPIVGINPGLLTAAGATKPHRRRRPGRSRDQGELRGLRAGPMAVVIHRSREFLHSSTALVHD